jgi:hypothetical protein
VILAANKHTPAQLTPSYAENKLLDIFLIIIARLRPMKMFLKMQKIQ